MDRRTRALLDVNMDDICAALGWSGSSVLRAFAASVLRLPALRFAREMTAFDDEVRESGIRDAARRLLSDFARDVRVSRADRIPARGPVLLCANHPGMTDTLALLASIPRADLLVLAADRPFLRALPSAARTLIFIPDEKEKRLPAVRRAIAHLKAGGALLTFPAGKIEPDPAVLPGAVEALEHWSASSIVFLRFAPDCTVVPVVVSGVLARPAQGHPLIHVRRRGPDRERMAAMLQVLVHTVSPSAWPVRIRVDVLEPRAARDLPRGEAEARDVLTADVARFLRLRERA
jgi:1-acyl-sn-glycerol-3-phosphate acyltransferase